MAPFFVFIHIYLAIAKSADTILLKSFTWSAMKLSKFGEKYTQFSGITQLMQDLNEGLKGDNVIMLGGGNPAQIPQVQEQIQKHLYTLLESGDLVNTISNYDGPKGKDCFIEALVSFFNDNFGWGISKNNIALTNGSQNAFFYIFNLLAGPYSDGVRRKVLFPLSPEYVGYADTALEAGCFKANKPKIEILNNRQFKYRIDFDNLTIDDDIGLICLSRPTNPSGNVVTDAEIEQLSVLAKQHKIPLLIDNAYGSPFPNILFESADARWDSNTILCMSLSKLGLPGARCGIVVADESLIASISSLNGILSLSPSGTGPLLANKMLEDDSLLTLSNEVIRPYYQAKSQLALEYLQEKITDPRFLVHKPEGAIFLWLWFKDLPINCEELYQRLKAKGLLIVPGKHFFPGMEDEWQHANECIRLNYSQDEQEVKAGIDILAEEIKALYAQQDMKA